MQAYAKVTLVVYSLRKTFGRQVYNMHSETSELALVKLWSFSIIQVLPLQKISWTKQEELSNTYGLT